MEATESMKALASKVREYRTKKRPGRKPMTQEQLAQAADVHINTIRKMELMTGTPTWESIEAVAKAMGADPHTLVRPKK